MCIRDRHRTVTCKTVAGVGANLKWQVEIEGQASIASSSTTKYIVPSINGLSGDAMAASGTTTYGGAAISISGTNFGPSSHTEVAAQYGPPGSTEKYTATGCAVISQTEITCVTAPGVGKDLRWSVTVGAQVSTVFTSDTTAYVVPEVTDLSGDAVISPSITEGGSEIVIAGDYFGPLGVNSDIQAHYGPSGSPNKYTATNCAVSSSQTEIRCNTIPGVGSGLMWSVTVGGQGSGVLTSKTTRYANPTVSTLSGAAADADGTATTGGADIVLTGTNFGPANAGTSISCLLYTSPSPRD